MEANPNKTYKQLKQKQKAKISDWIYKEVFLYYKEHEGFPDDNNYHAIYNKIYEKLKSLAIWCPYDEFERNMLKKREHIQERVIRDLTEGKTEQQFAKRPKKTEAEKLAIKRQQRKAKKKKLAEQRNKLQSGYLVDYDDTFAYIAGYTSGGAPYGVTWEEMEYSLSDINE